MAKGTITIAGTGIFTTESGSSHQFTVNGLTLEVDYSEDINAGDPPDQPTVPPPKPVLSNFNYSGLSNNGVTITFDTDIASSGILTISSIGSFNSPSGTSHSIDVTGLEEGQTYSATLVANDGTSDSDPTTVAITTSSTGLGPELSIQTSSGTTVDGNVYTLVRGGSGTGDQIFFETSENGSVVRTDFEIISGDSISFRDNFGDTLHGPLSIGPRAMLDSTLTQANSIFRINNQFTNRTSQIKLYSVRVVTGNASAGSVSFSGTGGSTPDNPPPATNAPLPSSSTYSLYWHDTVSADRTELQSLITNELTWTLNSSKGSGVAVEIFTNDYLSQTGNTPENSLDLSTLNFVNSEGDRTTILDITVAQFDLMLQAIFAAKAGNTLPSGYLVDRPIPNQIEALSLDVVLNPSLPWEIILNTTGMNRINTEFQ
ncbi:MAG: hypothetical protein AAGJ37_11955 [Pseudomonadota bacterium]